MSAWMIYFKSNVYGMPIQRRVVNADTIFQAIEQAGNNGILSNDIIAIKLCMMEAAVDVVGG